METDEFKNILNKLTEDILNTYPPAAQWLWELWQGIKQSAEEDVK